MFPMEASSVFVLCSNYKLSEFFNFILKPFSRNTFHGIYSFFWKQCIKSILFHQDILLVFLLAMIWFCNIIKVLWLDDTLNFIFCSVQSSFNLPSMLKLLQHGKINIDTYSWHQCIKKQRKMYEEKRFITYHSGNFIHFI